MEINIIHKKITKKSEKEFFKQLEELHKKYPDIFLSVKEYKKLEKELK